MEKEWGVKERSEGEENVVGKIYIYINESSVPGSLINRRMAIKAVQISLI